MRTLARFVRCYFKVDIYYRFEFLMQLLRDLLIMYCAYALWNALFTEGLGYEGSTREQVLVYGVFGALFTSFVTRDGCQAYISQRIRAGTMDADLLKPLNLQLHMLMRDVAQKLSKLILFTLPTLIVFICATQLFCAVRPQNLLLFLLSGALAYGVLFGINFLFGMICFFTLSIESISFCYTAVVTFLAGQMVPLWLFPGWAQGIINLLPFRCIFDIPMSIYIGRTVRAQAILDIGLQAFWVAALAALGAWAWHSVRKHIISQGG